MTLKKSMYKASHVYAYEIEGIRYCQFIHSYGSNSRK